MTKKRQQLPASAQQFLRSGANTRAKSRYLETAVKSFHRWLDAEGIHISNIDADDIDRYSKKPLRRLVSPRSAYLYTRHLKPYLLWLHQRDELSFDPSPLAVLKPRKPLPTAAQLFLQASETNEHETTIRRFYKWLDRKGALLCQLRAQDVESFFNCPGERPVGRPAAELNQRRLAPYLVWLHQRGEISFDPRPFDTRKNLVLPKSARLFLKTPEGKSLGPVVRQFHRWLAGKRMPVSGLGPVDVERFFERPFKNVVRPRVGLAYKRGLVTYLHWLDERCELAFDPQCLGIAKRVPLPDLALEFLRTLEPTHKQGTCIAYRGSLHTFHDWLAAAKIDLWRLERQHTEQWLLSLSDRGLAAATRVHIVLNVRAYLRWLFERRELRNDPEFLLRGSDLPKLPKYLPRPLSPHVDVELQRRFEKSDNVLWRALWLARQTGLRIGEIADLEHECIRTDGAGQSYLKVPLGKLNSERLVPLTDKARENIRWIQHQGSRPREWLIERDGKRETCLARLRDALTIACDGQQDGGRITPHRLRHSFATSMLNGGMSLVGVMKLLGHRDYRMTLRYAAVTPELVAREYFEAIRRLEDKYDHIHEPASAAVKKFNPIKALTDVVAYLNKAAADDRQNAQLTRSVTKRLLRIQNQIQTLGIP